MVRAQLLDAYASVRSCYLLSHTIQPNHRQPWFSVGGFSCVELDIFDVLRNDAKSSTEWITVTSFGIPNMFIPLYILLPNNVSWGKFILSFHRSYWIREVTLKGDFHLAETPNLNIVSLTQPQLAESLAAGRLHISSQVFNYSYCIDCAWWVAKLILLLGKTTTIFLMNRWEHLPLVFNIWMERYGEVHFL